MPPPLRIAPFSLYSLVLLLDPNVQLLIVPPHPHLLHERRLLPLVPLRPLLPGGLLVLLVVDDVFLELHLCVVRGGLGDVLAASDEVREEVDGDGEDDGGVLLVADAVQGLERRENVEPKEAAIGGRQVTMGYNH